MKHKYKKAFMEMAYAFSITSEAKRLQVGALIVKGDTIISQGVNGMPPNWPTEVCEEEILEDEGTFTAHFVLVTKPECRHAEIAALEKLWNSTETAKGSEMYITHSPCMACAIKIKTAGIKAVYFSEQYRDSSEAFKYLAKNNIDVEQINAWQPN